MLLERAEQLGMLRQALAAVVGGSGGRMVLVQGEAGIGKTALLREFRGGLGRSARALWAACDPLFTPRPLGPLADLAEVTGGELAALVGEGAKAYDVAAALLRALGSSRPAVVVLEDVHWADEATLDVIRVLARRLEQVAALIVVSYRDDQLGRTHPLRVVLGDMPADGRVTRVALGGLSAAAVAVLVGSAGLDPGELHTRTGGNPFFVTEVLAAGTGRIPLTVREAVLARAACLSPQALELLDAVAVVPGRAEMWLIQALAPSAAGYLDECLGSGMLTAEDGWISFRHEIERLVVEESSPPGRRAALHRGVLTALSESATGEPDFVRLSHHAEAAGDAGAILRLALAAAEHAAAAGARREAASLYARALRFANGMEPGDRADLLERFASQGYFTNRGDEVVAAALREALAIHRASGDLTGQGRVLRQLARQLGIDGRVSESRVAAHEAVAVLEQVPPGEELARAYATLSASYGLRDDAEGIGWGVKAITLAEVVGGMDALVYALNNVGTIQLRQGDHEGLAKLELSRELAEESGDEVGVGRAYLHLAVVLTARRDWALADRYLGPGSTYCRERGLDAWLSWLTVLTAESNLAHGRWADAADTAASILNTWPEGFRRSRCGALVVLGKVRARRGDSGYWPLLDEAAELARNANVPQPLLLVAAARAEAAWLEGAPAETVRDQTEQFLPVEMKSTPWFAGELACWRWRAGLPGGDPARLAEPYRLEITGEAAGAARWWEERGCRYEAALALTASGDPDTLRRALDMLRGLGARPAAAIVARRLRALGERGVPRGPRPGTSAHPAGLTGREAEVIALLAGGLTNAEIAARLVVSARTVDHHVAAILRKLGAQSRAEARDEAVRLGLASPEMLARPQTRGRC